MARFWVGVGAIDGLLAVAMAAISAHGLEAIGPERLRMVRDAVQMQGWHALALLFCGLWVGMRPSGWLAEAAGWAFLGGSALFCGAVYLRGLFGLPVGMVAPIGGTVLILGWALLAGSALRPGD